MRDYRYLRCLRFIGPLLDEEPANCKMDELVDADVDGESSLSWTSGDSAFSSTPVKAMVNQLHLWRFHTFAIFK